MARYSGGSPSHERAGEQEGDQHTPVASSPAPTYHPQQGPEYMPLPTSYPIISTERTPLLPSFQATPHKWVAHTKSTIKEAVHAIPAVILGLLLNILDGISCTFFDALV